MQSVRNRTRAMGMMAESGLINFNNQVLLGQGCKEILKTDFHLSSIELIEDATGNMIHFQNDKHENLIVTRVVRDPITNKLQMVQHDPTDLLLLKPKVLEKEARDPREYPYYRQFRNASGPNWTEIKAPAPGVFGNSEQSFSFVYPVYRKGTFLGMINAEISIQKIAKHIYAKSDKVGFGGSAFAVERRSDGTMIVLGIDTDGAKNNPVNLLQVRDSPIPSIRAFEKLVAKYDSKGINAMESTDTMVDQVDAEDGKTWSLAWTSIFPGEKPDWVIVTTARKDLLLADAWHRTWTQLYILIGVLFIGGIVIYFLARRASRPLEALSRDLIRIGKGNINPIPVPNFLIFELFDLAKGIEEMKTGLLSFQKYIPGEVVRQVLHSRRTADLFVEKKNITVLFSDLQDFTTMSESMDPDVLIRVLGAHLALTSGIIQRHRGTIDKFIGDSVMAFWNAPGTVEDHPIKACIVALECRAAMRSFNEENAARGLPRLFMRIGINSGKALVGNIGSENRLNYTAIGDTVNLGSRLEGINKVYGTWILISEFTNNELGGRILTRPVDRVSVKGKTQVVQLFEVLARSENSTAELQTIIDLTTRGFEHYLAGKFSDAKSCYEQLLTINPGDPLASFHVQRCADFISHPPPSDWNGVTHLHSK